MLKRAHLGAVASGTLALTAFFVVAPADAASSLKIHASAHARACAQLGQRTEKCRAYAHRNVSPPDELLFPYSGSYRYRYEPPESANGPYLGYEPYDGYASSLGFSF
jgi:hypothetical protein